jgi:hypothetical protein
VTLDQSHKRSPIASLHLLLPNIAIVSLANVNLRSLPPYVRQLTVNAYTRKARTDSGICLSFGGQTSGNTTIKNSYLL